MSELCKVVKDAGVQEEDEGAIEKEIQDLVQVSHRKLTNPRHTSPNNSGVEGDNEVRSLASYYSKD
jgi:hypothetical protein